MKYLLLFFLSNLGFSAVKPNIIVVFIDDMGYSDFSCFGGTVKTRHIDRLASEGIKFTNFYVNSPICSPSRVALTTGQYPHRYRITSYLNNRRDNKKRGMAQWLDPKAPTLARQLQQSGYATGHFGKWHMGGQRDVAEAPEISKYGFDQSLTNFEGIGPKLLPLTLKPAPGDGDPIPGRIWADAERLGPGFQWMQRSEITTGFIDKALAFIDKSQTEEKPFFINLWPDDVHGPWWPPLDKWGGSKRKLYQGVLDSMDEQLARLFDRIRNDPKLRNNTIITVCSDNGHEPGAGTSDPFRGAKTWMYEGGIRSPLVIWAPGLMPADKTSTTNTTSIFSAIDINRSLYTLAGIKPAQKLDGEDISTTLIGKSTASRVAPLFWRRPPDRPGFGHGFDEDNPDLAVRDGNWKYLVNHDGSTPSFTTSPTTLRNPRTLPDNTLQSPPASTRPSAIGIPKCRLMVSDPTFKKIGALPTDHFINPIGEGADPWVIRDPNAGRYLWCFSEGNRGIAIHTSQNLSSLGRKHTVWTAPGTGPYSKEIWAPELHFIRGKYVIYFAASDGQNKNHLAYALQSKTNDPLGDYELHGPFQTGDSEKQNLWAIDMTPLEYQAGSMRSGPAWTARTRINSSSTLPRWRLRLNSPPNESGFAKTMITPGNSPNLVLRDAASTKVRKSSKMTSAPLSLIHVPPPGCQAINSGYWNSSVKIRSIQNRGRNSRTPFFSHIRTPSELATPALSSLRMAPNGGTSFMPSATVPRAGNEPFSSSPSSGQKPGCPNSAVPFNRAPFFPAPPVKNRHAHASLPFQPPRRSHLLWSPAILPCRCRGTSTRSRDHGSG